MSHSHRWVWFFIVLIVLGAVALTVPFIYNLRAQLTPEQLADARALWAKNGPADYDLIYQERIDSGPVEMFRIEVRGGKVLDVFRREGSEETKLAKGELSPAQRQAYGVPALFGRIERYLDEDRAASRRNYVTAAFDSKDGHPVRYVRRVAGTQKRLECVVQLLPPHE